MFIETKINRLTKKQESKISLYCPFRAKIKENNIQSGVNTDKSLEGKKNRIFFSKSLTFRARRERAGESV
jgi:hypothetical protein